MRMNFIFSARGAKVRLIFLILFQKKKANWSANDFSDSWDGCFTSETLFRVLCSPDYCLKSVCCSSLTREF